MAKKKKVKIGKGISEYRLYVVFLPAFQNPRKEYNYYSEDAPNADFGLKKLLRRVLHGSCAGRYKLAMLYEEKTNKCLVVYVLGKTPMSYEQYLDSKTQKPLLKAQVKFKRPYIDKLISEGKRYTAVLKSTDNRSKIHALQNLKEQVMAEFQFNFRWADVYDQSNNKKVAKITGSGGVEYLNDKSEN